jgi:hypothetical protein
MLANRFFAHSRGVLLVVIAVSVIAGCSHSSDEEQVLAVIEAAEAAAEARDTSDALDLVAADYADARGLDKAQLQSFLRAYFLTHPKIELLVRSGPVELETANRARVRVEVVMLGTQRVSDDGPGALTGESESLQVELQRRDSEWRVTRVDRVRN